MKQSFALLNIKCSGCANTLKKGLKEEFGEVEVDLSVVPRLITLEIEDENIDNLKTKVKSMGYPFASQELGFIDEAATKAKSFVSCAIGKLDV
ncbi:MAG: heavy metal transporter [Sulfurovum sp. FS08-3]|nr:MAG: heavy metal transporter [Sulfurovum sp. FS08-3]